MTPRVLSMSAERPIPASVWLKADEVLKDGGELVAACDAEGEAGAVLAVKWSRRRPAEAADRFALTARGPINGHTARALLAALCV